MEVVFGSTPRYPSADRVGYPVMVMDWIAEHSGSLGLPRTFYATELVGGHAVLLPLAY